MKKVLFVVDKMVLGGAEKVLVDIINNLPKNKYEITIFALFDGGELSNHIHNGVKSISWFNKQYKGIYRIIKYMDPKKIYTDNIKEEFDIEISFKTGMPEKIVAASPNNKSLKIAWIHGDMTYQNYGLENHRSKKRQLDCYSKFDRIVCVSEKCVEGFMDVIGDFKKFSVIHNGVDIDNVRLLANERKELDYSSDKVIFSTISRLNYEKGIDRLILAVEKLVKEKLTDFHIYIVGGGILKNDLQDMINERSLNDYITLLGAKSNPFKYVNGSDAFILSSRSEALCISVIESMALELPVISTNCGGVTEIIGDSEFGILVENSQEGIYQGLRQFIQKKLLLKEIYTKKSSERSKDFSLNSMISKIEVLFENA
ncbi:glycosyltransferase [Gottfriedia acidiceleris]|uniref:glycosyltransferase n=1 Tax=Gottfriedia acidiceleris TaxID=371036 RepID=UPI00101DA082|nr:glycosyltransferase [Gottfriedia acidiceleris]